MSDAAKGGGGQMAREVQLEPGWLLADAPTAARRLDEWNQWAGTVIHGERSQTTEGQPSAATSRRANKEVTGGQKTQSHTRK